MLRKYLNIVQTKKFSTENNSNIEQNEVESMKFDFSKEVFDFYRSGKGFRLIKLNLKIFKDETWFVEYF